MRGTSSQIRGITLLETIIYVFVSSVLLAIFATSFVSAKRSVETMAKEQNKLDFVWKISGIYDYLLASEANPLSGLKSIYLEDKGIYIPVVCPYKTAYSSLKDAPDGFYAGECEDETLALYQVKDGKASTLHGDCFSPPFYFLGYGGIAAFVAIKSDGNGKRIIVEGVNGEIFTTSLGKGGFSLEMKDENGSPVTDSSKAAFISIKFLPENLEVSSWREK